MGIVVGVAVFFISLVIIYRLARRSMALRRLQSGLLEVTEKTTSSMTLRLLRPYIGMLLIAVLIMILGVVLNILFDGSQSTFNYIAKVIAVLNCSILCLHLIVIVGKKLLVTKDNDDA
jgi:hypothetical protein